MRLIDADGLVKGRVENDPVRIAAMCAPTVYDVDEVAGQLRNAGGCDGSTEYAKGWDDAMEEAERIVKAGAGKVAKADWKGHIARRFSRVE